MGELLAISPGQKLVVGWCTISLSAGQHQIICNSEIDSASPREIKRKDGKILTKIKKNYDQSIGEWQNEDILSRKSIELAK